ncbi:MAG: aspartate kinase [Candidatus Rifleibacteriota bacterium]
MFANGEVLIQKFGGSSMATVERIQLVAERIAVKARKGHRIVVVVSAMADTTDELISLMQNITSVPDRREMDQVMATGEIVSASLMASSLRQIGIRSRSFNAFNLHLLSEIENEQYNIVEIGRRNMLARFLEPGSVAVVAGFQGVTAHGDLTTLGRGGSDLTAVVMARELGQKVCEKFTDENGIYSADPRIIPDARKIWHLNYDEMLQLALFGNGILHPRAISSAKDSEIRIHVRSSFTKAEGSVVGPDGDPEIPIKSIACDESHIVVKIQSAKLPDSSFNTALENSGFSPTITQWLKYNDNRGSIRIAFKRKDSFNGMLFCWDQASRLDAEEVVCFADLNTVSLVGCGLKSIDTKLFIRQLENLKIVPVVIQNNEIRMSFSIAKDKASKAVQIIHKTLLEQINFTS